MSTLKNWGIRLHVTCSKFVTPPPGSVRLRVEVRWNFRSDETSRLRKKMDRVTEFAAFPRACLVEWRGVPNLRSKHLRW